MAQHYPTIPQVVDETEQVPVYVPRYATCHTSIVATGKQGSAPGELRFSSGLAIHEETHQIFVANMGNDRVEIFSETGEFFHQLGVRQLWRPHSIVIHGDSVYVSSLFELCRVRRIGGQGSNNGQFNFPRQLTTDPIGCVFIADFWNHRICIHDPDLNHLRNITLQSNQDHGMLKYHVTVSTYCVQMTTRVCMY